MLPRDRSGYPLDPVEDLDRSLQVRTARRSDANREAAIAAL